MQGSLQFGTEVLLAVVSCLLFFAAFLAMLGAIFPQATDIRDLIGRADRGSARLAQQESPTVAESTAAVLTVLNRDVRVKRVDEIAWRSASTGIVLAGGDGVQTSSGGEAEVAFDEANQVRLGRNTLIVIKRPSRNPSSGRTQSSVAVLSGELWAQVPSSAEREVDLQIEAGGARTRIRSGSAEVGDPKVKVTVGPDQRSTIAVMGGTADVEANGRMMRLSANQFTTVDSTGMLPAQVLLNPPVLQTPEADASLEAKGRHGITFTWESIENAERYRFTLSSDEDFNSRPTIDRQTVRTALSSGPLAPGEYFWRVTGVRSSVEGSASTRRLVVRPSTHGPPLRVELPPALVHESKFTISGTTLPWATVFARGKRVVAGANGRFRLEVALERGANVVVVEAIDAQGNSSYASTVVNAKF